MEFPQMAYSIWCFPFKFTSVNKKKYEFGRSIAFQRNLSVFSQIPNFYVQGRNSKERWIQLVAGKY